MRNVIICIITTYALAASAVAVPVTTIYEFVTEQSNVITSNRLDLYYWPVEGRFQMTVDFDTGDASFDWVNATYREDRNLDTDFEITNNPGVLISDTEIYFEGDTILGITSHITCRVDTSPWLDSDVMFIEGLYFYGSGSASRELDAVASVVPEPATFLVFGLGGLFLTRRRM